VVFHFITPPYPINWSTPKTLSKTVLYNSTLKINPLAPKQIMDTPVGHCIMEAKFAQKNSHGVDHVMTGMSRADKLSSVCTTLTKGLGNGAMFHTFKGMLDQSQVAWDEITLAKKANRHYSIKVNMSVERSAELQAFMNDWIEYGACARYGGNGNVGAGEKAGCADFAMYFMLKALETTQPLEEWMRVVNVPRSTLPKQYGGDKSRVSFLKLLGTKEWASSEVAGSRFATPDPELMASWIQKHFPGQTEIVLEPKHLIGMEQSAKDEIGTKPFFKDVNQMLPPEKQYKIWKDIALSQ
jgi:hypothetical protein